MTGRRDDGFALVEVLVVVVLVGVLAVPLTGLLVTVLRTTASAEASATRVAVAVTALAVAERVEVVDGCDAGELAGAVAERVTVPDGFGLEVGVDCSEAPTLVVVEVVDRFDRVTELVGVRS